MRSLINQPLFHFLLMGALLLALYSAFGPLAPSLENSGAVEPVNRKIRVDAEALNRFVQSKTGIVDPETFRATWVELDATERRRWLDLFVREEALVREARMLGLDQQDDLIRRRLVQQIEFVALGAVEQDLVFGEQELEQIYRERGEDHRIPTTFSFNHVYVAVTAGGTRSEEEARAQAKAILGDLNRGAAKEGSALGRGDRFLYNRSYVDRTLGEVASHFGDAMARELVRLEPDPLSWKGPLRSTHGFHLVLLTSLELSRLPGANEIRGRLREDWLRKTRDEALEAEVGKIVASYDVELDQELSPLR
jgi:peptidyl-prolyl cis-trans isomerase C